MANMMDYLDWRGDLSFNSAPFNNIDNLILSEIAYTNFHGLVDSFDKDSFDLEDTVSISDVSNKYREAHPDDKFFASNSHIEKAPFLMMKAAESKRFSELKMTGYINEIIPDSEVQFSVITFILPDKSAFIAFRGTDHSIVGWQEDFNMSFKSATTGQKMAVKYINAISKNFDVIRVGGHSKGGNFAVYGSAFSSDEFKKKLINVYSNDGPGFRDEILQSDEYKSILDKVISIIPEQSMVGMILGNEYNHKIIKSTGSGVQQHDAFTWQLIGNKFETMESQGIWSNVFNDTLHKWLETINDEEREEFVSILFTSIAEECGGPDENIPASIPAIMKSVVKHLSGLPKEKQTLFYDILKKLIKSSGLALKDNLPKPDFKKIKRKKKEKTEKNNEQLSF